MGRCLALIVAVGLAVVACSSSSDGDSAPFDTGSRAATEQPETTVATATTTLPSWSTRGFDVVGPNIGHVAILPDEWARDPSKVGVIYLHGAGNDETQAVDSSTEKVPEIVQAIADAGHPVLSVGVGDSWGNYASMSTIGEAVAYLTDVIGAHPTAIGFVGGSMGSATALNWIARHMTTSAFFVGLVPVVDIDDIYVNNRGRLSANVDAAYDNSWSEAYWGAQRNPVTMAAEGGFDGLPMQLWWGDTDTIVLPDVVAGFAADVGATVDEHPVTGNHTNTFDNVPVADVVAFVEANVSGATPADPGAIPFPAPTDYNPAAVSGLALWLDPSDPATIQYSAGTTVSELVDKSRNGCVFTPTGIAPEHNFVANGLTALNFQGSDGLQCPDARINNATDGTFTVFAAVLTIGSVGNQSLLVGSPHQFITFRSGGALDGTVWMSGGGRVSFSGPDDPAKNARIVHNVGTTSTVQAFSNNVGGTAVSIESFPQLASPPNPLTLGDGYVGVVLEVVGFSRELTTDEKTDAVHYLAGRWAAML